MKMTVTRRLTTGIVSLATLFLFFGIYTCIEVSSQTCDRCLVKTIPDHPVGIFQCAPSGGGFHDCFQYIYDGYTACCDPSGNYPCSALSYDPTLIGFYWKPANGWCTVKNFCANCSPVNFLQQDPIIQHGPGPRCLAFGTSTPFMGRNICQ